MALRKAKQDDSAATIKQLQTEIATLKKRLETWESTDEKYVAAQKHLGGIQNRRIAKLIEVSATANNSLREIAAAIIAVTKDLAAERVKHIEMHNYNKQDLARPIDDEQDTIARQRSVDAMMEGTQ